MLFIALLFLSTQSFAGERCSFDVVPADSGDFVDQLEKMAQDGCGTLNMMSLGDEDYEKAQDRARKSCCKRANKFIKKRLGVCSDEGRLRTKIELVREVCGNIDDGHDLTFSADVCYSNLTDAIDDPGFRLASDQCQKKHKDEVDRYGDIEALKNMGALEEDDMKCLDDALHARAKALPIEKLEHLSVDAANCPETRASDAKTPVKGAPPISGAGATLPDAASGGGL